MKIVSFKKFIRSILIILGIILILSLLINKSALSHTETEYKTIYVSNGDTLWTIAQNLQCSNYYDGKDIRYIINNLMEVNSLSSSTLYVNQELKVPVV